MQRREALVVFRVHRERSLLFRRRMCQERKRLGVVAAVLELDRGREIRLRRGPDTALVWRHPEFGELARHTRVIRRAQRDGCRRERAGLLRGLRRRCQVVQAFRTARHHNHDHQSRQGSAEHARHAALTSTPTSRLASPPARVLTSSSRK